VTLAEAMRVKNRVGIIAALLLFSIPINAIGKTGLAKECGVSPELAADRIFADPDGKLGWREYHAVNEVPTLGLDVGILARLWMGQKGTTLILLEEPGEDFYSYTHYCFDSNGALVSLRFELRTAWGWSFRIDGRIENGKLRPKTSEFFNTKTDLPVARPEQADDVAGALKPHLYLRKSSLPFAKLLSEPTSPIRS
jgi:hypothetical protein